MNECFSNNNLDKKWLFVDRSHLTDLGNEYVAEFISSKLSQNFGFILINMIGKVCNEKKLYYYAKEKLKIKEYFPGFFVTIGEKI